MKMALAAGFVAVGAVRSTGDSYSRWILLGLLLSVAGDAFLLSEARRAFLAGLLAFLLAHLAYAVAFAPRARPALPVLAVIALATAAVLAWLWPRLGAMRVPVAGYALAIGLMLWLASGVGRPSWRPAPCSSGSPTCSWPSAASGRPPRSTARWAGRSTSPDSTCWPSRSVEPAPGR